jgi:hypothetical protein
MIRRVLGIDIATIEWALIGSATIDFDDDSRAFTSVIPHVIPWPDSELTPGGLAETIDAFVRNYGVSAVALDGPQGWRDPSTSVGEPGVGRRCEYYSRTPGKTGTYPTTYPGNQRQWIAFSIEVFAKLLTKPGVELADSEDWEPSSLYGVLECFPTSAWRTSGLSPLPGKSRRPQLDSYIEAIRSAYQLPAFETASYDDLQAVVAALAAAAAVGGPAVRLPEGQSSRLVSDQRGSRRVEGLIWNVRPMAAEPVHAGRVAAQQLPILPTLQASSSNGSVYVTQRVLDQVVRAGKTQMQIAISNKIGANGSRKVRLSIEASGNRFELIAGDTHAIWRSHQEAETIESFEQLFAMLSDIPGQPLAVTITMPD